MPALLTRISISMPEASKRAKASTISASLVTSKAEPSAASPAAAVQTLGVKRQSDPVMPQNLGQIATATAEYEKIAAMGVALETLLNLQGQPLHAASHVRMAGRDPDPTARRNRDHRRSSTCSTLARAAASTLVSTMTRRSLPTTITIRPLAGAASIVGAVSAAATTIAGTKPACC